jgi:hypothetical protein
MRKVLSFVLVLSLVLGSFSMAFAAPTTGYSDMNGEPSAEAVAVLSDLGVITGYPDGTFKPDNTLTRAEAAIVIVKALGLEHSVGAQTSNYTDMAGYGWAEGYIAFATNLGILSGYGDGTFKPGNTVSYNEMARMLVSALGYTPESLTGTWPANFVSKATALGIMDGIKSGGNAGANRGDVAIMTSNNLRNQIGTVNNDDIWSATIKDGRGTDADPYVYDTMAARLGGELVEGVIDADWDSLINLLPYLGKYAQFYVNNDEEVIAISEVLSTELTGNFSTSDSAIDLVAGTGIEFEADDDVDYRLRVDDLDNDYTEFINGEDATIAELDADIDYTINVKLSGRNIVEWYSTIAWEVTEGALADADDIADIADAELLRSDFDTDRSGNIIANSFELIGVDSLDDIKVDNVVYVYEGDEFIKRVAVGTKVVEGKVTRHSGSTYTVDGTGYKFATIDDATSDRPGVGDEVKLFIDAYGKIFDYEEIAGTPDTYAIVLAADDGGVDGDRVRIHTSDDTKKTFNVDYDGYTASAAMTAKLIGYSIDRNGDIDNIEYATAEEVDSLNLRNIVLDTTSTYAIAADVPVFVLDGANVDRITTYANVDRDEIPDNDVYYILDGNKIVALAGEFKGGASDDAYGVFSSYSVVYDADQDDNVAELVGFIDGTSATKRANKVFADMKTSVEAIGLYLVEMDADGYITTIVGPESTEDEGEITSLANSKMTVTLSSGTYDLVDDVVIYEVTMDGAKVDKYTARSASALRDGYTVYLYDTDSEEDGIEVVIFVK